MVLAILAHFLRYSDAHPQWAPFAPYMDQRFPSEPSNTEPTCIPSSESRPLKADCDNALDRISRTTKPQKFVPQQGSKVVLEESKGTCLIQVKLGRTVQITTSFRKLREAVEYVVGFCSRSPVTGGDQRTLIDGVPVRVSAFFVETNGLEHGVESTAVS